MSLKPVAKPEFYRDDDATPRPPWTEYTKQLGKLFSRNVEERVVLARERKRIEEQIKDLDAAIKDSMSTLGSVRSVAVGLVKVTMVSQTRTSIVKEMMLDEMMKLGIDAVAAAEAVNRATKVSATEFVKVTAPKEIGDE